MTTDGPDAQPSIRTDLDRLVAFLLARLDEDEAAARTLLRSGEILPFESISQTTDHTARHGPLRVLREVAAKQTVVRSWRDSPGTPGRPDAAEAFVVAMATVFATHPDFDPTWLAGAGERGEEPDTVAPLEAI